MEKIIIHDDISFDITEGISIEDFIKKYHELTSKVMREYESAYNFKIECESGYYNDNENYYQSIIISFNRLETNDEFEIRKNQQEWRKESAIKSLKQMIDRNQEEAVKYIKELGLI